MQPTIHVKKALKWHQLPGNTALYSSRSSERDAFLEALDWCLHTIFLRAWRTGSPLTPRPQRMLGFTTYVDIEPKVVPENDIGVIAPVLGYIKCCIHTRTYGVIRTCKEESH